MADELNKNKNIGLDISDTDKAKSKAKDKDLDLPKKSRAEEEAERKKLEQRRREKEEQREREQYERELAAAHQKRKSITRSPVGSGARVEMLVFSEGESEKAEEEETETEEYGRKRGREEYDSPRTRAKRTRSLEDGRGLIQKEKEKETSYLETVDMATSRVSAIMAKLHKSKQISRATMGEVESIFVEVKEAMLKMRAENEFLKGKFEGWKEILDMIKTQGREQTGGEKPSIGYADAVKRNLLEVQGRGGRRWVEESNTILVMKEGSKSEDIRKEITGNISHRREGIRVRRVAKIRHGVAIEVETKKEAEELAKKIGESETDWEVRKPKNRYQR